MKTPQEALESKLKLAAKFIDSEQYDRFESMRFEHMDKESIKVLYYGNHYYINHEDDVIDRTPYVIMDFVNTLKGAQYLEERGLIPKDYFSLGSREIAPIMFASYEQLEFYANRTDINAEVDCFWDNSTLLDVALTSKQYSSDFVKKVIELGGKPNWTYLGYDQVDTIPGVLFYMKSEDKEIRKNAALKMQLLYKSGLLDDAQTREIMKKLSVKDATEMVMLDNSNMEGIDYLKFKQSLLELKVGELGKTGDSSKETKDLTKEKKETYEETAQTQVNITRVIMKARRAGKVE